MLDPPMSRSLTTDPFFVTYWISETLNDLSESVGVLALSLTAVVILAADPFQMGVLGAARTLPYMGLGLLAGVVVDRTRRRPVMFAAGLLSGTLLLLVPLTAFAGVLRVELLYLVAFGTGALTLVGNVAHRAFLPIFVGRSRLVPANSLLHLSGAAAQIAGPTAAGFLIQLLTAPLALVVSAVAAIASALMLLYVRVIEPRPAAGMQRGEVLDEMREGLWIVLGDPQLRAIMLTGTTHNFFSNGMLVTLYVLFASEHLRLSAAEIGLVFAVGG